MSPLTLRKSIFHEKFSMRNKQRREGKTGREKKRERRREKKEKKRREERREREKADVCTYVERERERENAFLSLICLFWLGRLAGAHRDFGAAGARRPQGAQRGPRVLLLFLPTAQENTQRGCPEIAGRRQGQTTKKLRLGRRHVEKKKKRQPTAVIIIHPTTTTLPKVLTCRN